MAMMEFFLVSFYYNFVACLRNIQSKIISLFFRFVFLLCHIWLNPLIRISNGNVTFCEFRFVNISFLPPVHCTLYMNKSHSQLYLVRIEYPKMVSENIRQNKCDKQQTANDYEDDTKRPMKTWNEWTNEKKRIKKNCCFKLHNFTRFSCFVCEICHKPWIRYHELFLFRTLAIFHAYFELCWLFSCIYLRRSEQTIKLHMK